MSYSAKLIIAAMKKAGSDSDMIISVIETLDELKNNKNVDEPDNSLLFRKNKKPISLLDRKLIHARDRNRCVYCRTDRGPFDVDHIIPRIGGGNNLINNLVLSCASCNRSKSDMHFEEWCERAGNDSSYAAFIQEYCPPITSAQFLKAEIFFYDERMEPGIPITFLMGDDL